MVAYPTALRGSNHGHLPDNCAKRIFDLMLSKNLTWKKFDGFANLK